MKVRYSLTVGYAASTGNNKTWKEEYELEVSDPEQWAKNTIKRYNDTLRPQELPRRFISIEVLSDCPMEHDWDKNITGMSINFRGATVDIMQCRGCGITGKRYGWGNRVTRDSKYRAKKYQACPGVKVRLKDE